MNIVDGLNIKKLKLLLIVFLGAQFAFWYNTESIKPNVHIVPDLPSKYAVEGLSFGDKQFYFRNLAMKIQNAGDSFGRFTALKYYDYEKLYQWFSLLDRLDKESNFVPALASYYYAQTQNKADTIHVAKYLEEHSDYDPEKKWWWLFQAMYVAYHVLEDEELALRLAYKLKNIKAQGKPLWTEQMPAFIHLRRGEDCAAYAVINAMIDDHDSGKRKFSDKEMNFMQFFITKRINKLKKKRFDPHQCIN